MNDVHKWNIVRKSNRQAKTLADRHYNRRNPYSSLFTPPGYNLVLLSNDGSAVWNSNYQHYRLTDFKGYINTIFRNEGTWLSSQAIQQAVRLTIDMWGPAPFRTYVDPRKITNKARPGWCYIKAGWHQVGTSSKGLLIYELPSTGSVADSF
jgi:hypothetical protein